MMRMIRLLLLLIFTLKSTTEAVSLDNRMNALILKPDKMPIIEDENMRIEFDEYEETAFHDSGSGIEVVHWDEIMESLASDYNISEKIISELKMAKTMQKGEILDKKYILGEKKKRDTFEYLQVAVGKEDDGMMSYVLMGKRIDFKLKHVVKQKTTINLLFFKFEYGKEDSIPVEDEYTLYKAKLSLHHGFKVRIPDTCEKKSWPNFTL